MISSREEAVAQAKWKSAIHARSNGIDILSVVPIQTGDIGRSGGCFDVVQLLRIKCGRLIDVVAARPDIQRRIIDAIGASELIRKNLRPEPRGLYPQIVLQDEVDAFFERNR